MPRSEEFDREKVIDQAKRVFWSKGYHGTSMQDLVDATQLNRSSIYNSFGSKMDLYKLTLESYARESAGIFSEVAKQKKNAMESIGLIFLYEMNRIFNDDEKNGCMIINSITEMGNQSEDLELFLTSNHKDMVRRFEDLVRRGQQEGSIRNSENSLHLSNYLVSAFQGFKITGLYTKDLDTFKGVIQNILKTIA
ncbi:MAG: TetR/AcrR family transcriptional regulator [Flavobacteriaceae bacterium]|nr:TetR/AcrR family transcriptional regulator [Flavobacteriaceae bacterium]